MNGPSDSPTYVFEPLPLPAVPVAGSGKLFPVHRIYCVGRNYAEHALEMGGDPTREPPFFFQKNPDCLVVNDGNFPYPTRTKDVHHEIELVIAIGAGGDDIPVDAALEHVYGYAVGIDMTRRDLQGEAKKQGRPWETGKAFEASAPCSDIMPASIIGHPTSGPVWLKVNGTLRQKGNLNQMIWKVPETVSYLSGLFTLQPGDLIFTGTPAGVAAVSRGDELHGGVEGIGELRTRVI
ncbi:fumarylpyruvate hydrolase [Rhodoligotrophos appendicifer]|uniref:fumarylacetoacetate hydrolase family protein n=1 Tax=Rhodoligotrophos appendicifer TaxID=987056 RepID=UPI0011868285|nr:fumarylacetoacetate hydrolase family protein [Rhodoligotrophos appendicifer]